ncbi:hypothetical protein [Streptomyces sp. SID14515]|uniref:hypothetical protein n=1 Tax=Streptomyces sp. SID14515 TaxID=2706074 RepID=UPI0013C75F4D|nr:hypothetical protein [Streptomyces sp. SID14515]NEB42569.1 hypothetical protein [Streptomyces sp. SID14515]
MSAVRHGKSARRDAKRPVPVVKGQADLLTEWREVGLITPAQYATFTRSPRSNIYPGEIA